MDIFTVSFFGHREMDDPFRAERRLQMLIRNLLIEKEYVVFLVGRDKPIDIPDNGMIVKDGLCLKRIKKLLLDYLRFGTIDIIDTLRVQPKATVNVNLRTEVLGDTFTEELAIVVCLESVSVCMSVFAHRLI